VRGPDGINTCIVFTLIGCWNAYVLYGWRQNGALDLVARLLSTAAVALRQNANLVSMSAAVLLAYASFVLAPALGFLYSAGELQSCSGHTAFPNLVFVVTSAAISWAGALSMELRLFTTAHVVARWYELPVGSRLEGRPVREAFSLAVGPSLGSLCVGALVLNAIEFVRELLARILSRLGPAGIMLQWIANGFARFTEFLTRFATIGVALGGDRFFVSGRHSTELFYAAGCQGHAVWFLPQYALFAVSACVSIIAALVATVIYSVFMPSIDSYTAAQLQQLVTYGVFLLTVSCIQFLNGLLLSIVDALYFCFAADKVAKRMQKPDVHAVMADVVHRQPPKPGALVRQPDGETGYAAV